MTATRDGFNDDAEGLPEDVFDRLAAEGESAASAMREHVDRLPGGEQGLREFAAILSAGRAPDAPADPVGLGREIERREQEARRAPRRQMPYVRSRRAATLRAAAVLAVGLGLGALWPAVRAAIGPEQLARVVVPPASHATLELPGGVTVRLNYASRLAYEPGSDVREVLLEGEAYFSVPDGVEKNFLVHTAAGVVRDLGTEFNVRARGGRVAVVVTDGTVELATERGSVRVDAGEQSHAARGRAPASPSAARMDAALGWTRGRLVLYDQPLGFVAAELERRYGVPFDVAPALLAKRITAVITRSATAADAARVLCMSVEGRCEQAGNGWRISVP